MNNSPRIVLEKSLVIRTIQQEIGGSGKCVGYRAMWQRLRNDHRIDVSRETVRLALRIIDPTRL